MSSGGVGVNVSQDARAAHIRGVLPDLWAFALAALMLGPALRRGFVLSYDMVWVPQLSLRPDFWGLGQQVPRAVPSDAVIALLDNIVPGMALQKFILIGALVGAGMGASRLARKVGATSLLAQFAAVTIAVWNPFVVERLAMGHWPVLLGYAAILWVPLVRNRPALAAVILVGSLSASAGIASAVAVLAVRGWRAEMRERVILVGMVACANAPWLLAGLVNAGIATGSGASLFALRGEGTMPPWLTALTLGGIWNRDAMPDSRAGLLAWAMTVLLVALVAAGWRAWRRTSDPGVRNGPLAMWLVGYGVACVTAFFPAAMDALATSVPGAGVLRDGSRLLSLCVPLLVICAALGVETIARRWPNDATHFFLAIAAVVMPLALLWDAAWGLTGRLKPADYPADYAHARQVLDSQPAGETLIVPFTAFRAPSWNHGHTVLDPLGRYLPFDYVSSNALRVNNTESADADPHAGDVRRALAAATAQERSTRLRALGVRYVVRDLDAAAAGLGVANPTVAGKRLYDSGSIEVIGLAASGEERVRSTSVRLLVGLGWLAWAGLLVSAAVRVARGVRSWRHESAAASSRET